jgi:hypothetical protein
VAHVRRLLRADDNPVHLAAQALARLADGLGDYRELGPAGLPRRRMRRRDGDEQERADPAQVDWAPLRKHRLLHLPASMVLRTPGRRTAATACGGHRCERRDLIVRGNRTGALKKFLKHV